MPTSLRLNGDRDRAAQWWGEAKRILFQLKTNLDLCGVPHGWRERTCTDGTRIRVGHIAGFDIIDINSPFKPIIPVEKEVELGDVFIFYFKTVDGVDVPMVAICKTPILLGEDKGVLYKMQCSKFNFTTGLSDRNVISQRFTNYSFGDKETGPLWYIRMPFVFSGDATKGHYFFEGFTTSGYSDYLYIEKTAKFHLIKESASGPFCIGNFIYGTIPGPPKKLVAYTFNPETEAVTVAKELEVDDETTYVDDSGHFYYPSSTPLVIKGNVEEQPDILYQNDILWIGLDPYYDGVGWANHDGVGKLFLYCPPVASSYYNDGPGAGGFGNWIGGICSEPYQTFGGGSHQSKKRFISIKDLMKIDIWSEAVEVGKEKSYNLTSQMWAKTMVFQGMSTPGDPPVSSKMLKALSWKSYLQAFPVVNSAKQLTLGYKEEDVTIDYGIPVFTETWDSGDPPPPTEWFSVTIEHSSDYSEQAKVFSLTENIVQSADGTHFRHYLESPPGYDVYNTDMAADVTADNILDYEDRAEVLDFPFGTPTSPFFIYNKSAATKSMVADETNWGPNFTISAPAPTDSKKFISPYDEVNLDISEDVNGWLHLCGKEVLTQAVIGSGSLGKRLYNNGVSSIDQVAAVLKIPANQIQSILYLPEIDKRDPLYQEKIANL